MGGILFDLFRQRGIQLRRVASTHGGEYAGPCPACGGRDRCRVWPEQNEGKGSYWCRRCGARGDAIQFLRDFEDLGFREACDRLGLDVPGRPRYQEPRQRRRGSEWTPRPETDPPEAWKERTLALVVWAYDQLVKNDEILAYLAGRGIRPETAERFGLGWNPGDGKGRALYRSRESWGLSPVKAENGRGKPLWLPIGLVVPFVSPDSGVFRIRIRQPDSIEFGPRYYLVPGGDTRTMVLGSHRLHVVVEAELDAMLIAQEAGDLVTAVALGSSSARPTEAAARALRGSMHILNALDFDTAGAEALAWWQRHYPDMARWPVPTGKDPGEAWAAGVDLRAWILAGLPEGVRMRLGNPDFVSKRGNA